MNMVIMLKGGVRAVAAAMGDKVRTGRRRTKAAKGRAQNSEFQKQAKSSKGRVVKIHAGTHAEKRRDKNGRLVTRYVRNQPKSKSTKPATVSVVKKPQSTGNPTANYSPENHNASKIDSAMSNAQGFITTEPKYHQYNYLSNVGMGISFGWSDGGAALKFRHYMSVRSSGAIDFEGPQLSQESTNALCAELTNAAKAFDANVAEIYARYGLKKRDMATKKFSPEKNVVASKHALPIKEVVPRKKDVSEETVDRIVAKLKPTETDEETSKLRSFLKDRVNMIAIM